MPENNVSVLIKMRGSKEFKRDADSAGRSVRGITDNTRNLGTAARRTDRDLSRHRRGVGLLGRGARGAALGIGGLVGGLAAVGQARRAVSTTTDLAKAQIGLSRNLALSNQEAGEWAAIAKVRGIDNKSLNLSFTTLSKNVNAATDRGSDQAKMFRRLGVSQADLRRGQSDFNFLIRQTADGFGRLRGGTLRQETAQRLLGRGYQSVLPLFTEGSKSLDQQIGLANKYGAVIGGKPIKSQQDLIKVQRELQYAQLGFQVQLATKIAPRLVKGFDLILRAGNSVRPAFDWAKKHGDFVKTAAAVAGVAVAAHKLDRFARGGSLFARGLAAGGRLGVAGLRRSLSVARPIVSRIMGGAGATGGKRLASTAASNAASTMPATFSRQRSKFSTVGTNTGRTMGKSAGTSAAGALSDGIVTSSRGGRIAGAFRTGGKLAGGVFAAAAVPLILGEIGKAVNNNKFEDGSYKPNGTNPGGLPNPITEIKNLFGGATGGHVTRRGIVSYARGGRSLVPKGEDTLAGLRYGEFVQRQSAVRREGLGAMQALNEGRARITMPDREPMAMGGVMSNQAPRIDLHLTVELDGQELDRTQVKRVDRKAQRR